MAILDDLRELIFGKNDAQLTSTPLPLTTPFFANQTNETTTKFDAILDLEYRLPPILPNLVNHSFENPAKAFSWMAGGFVNLIMTPFEEMEQLAVDVHH